MARFEETPRDWLQWNPTPSASLRAGSRAQNAQGWGTLDWFGAKGAVCHLTSPDNDAHGLGVLP